MSTNATTLPRPLRILLGGATGTGKSTTLARVFELGNQELASAKEPKVHQPLKYGSDLIMHDSEGFQSGVDDELKIFRHFVLDRCQAVDFKDRVHLIWFFVALNTPRPITSGAQKIFELALEMRIPILVVFTKWRALEALVRGRMTNVVSTLSPDAAAEEVKQKTISDFKVHILPQLAPLGARPPYIVLHDEDGT
ncbi:hypothetical protein P7C70_g4166, partial [Phenoliferia sp. Uapishka_3]